MPELSKNIVSHLAASGRGSSEHRLPRLSKLKLLESDDSYFPSP
jgi:hypothetical protein